MRTMPTIIRDGHRGIEVPTITASEWNATLECIAGRPLTDGERARAEKMARHNWTLRVVAAELFGDAADRYFADNGERRAYQWAAANQGYAGTYEDWLSLPANERAEYELGAAGVPTQPSPQSP